MLYDCHLHCYWDKCLTGRRGENVQDYFSTQVMQQVALTIQETEAKGLRTRKKTGRAAFMKVFLQVA